MRSYVAIGLTAIRSILFSILGLLSLLSQLPHSPPPPPQSADGNALEEETGVAQPDHAQEVPLVHDQNADMGFWPKLMVAFCLASAIDIAILSIQNHWLPLGLHLVCVTLLLSFTFFFVSEFIDNSKFSLTIIRLRRFGVFFGATAFFIAIAIPVPMFLKCVTGFIYFISILVILIFNFILG